MNNIVISDITLRGDNDFALSFKEKIEVVKYLDRLNVDVIEVAPIKNGKTDILFLHSVAPTIKNSTLSCVAELDENSVVQTFDAIKEAKNKRIHIMIPVSTVQMEYVLHLKPNKLIEKLKSVVNKAKELTDNIEISLKDATRAEKDFLVDVLNFAVSVKPEMITLCDSAGTMLPSEFSDFVTDLKLKVPELEKLNLSVECSDALGMASACAISCIENKICGIKSSVLDGNCPSLSNVCHILKEKGNDLGADTKINMSVLDDSIKKIKLMLSNGNNTSPFDGGTNKEVTEKITITSEDSISTVKNAAVKLGYDLNEEDVSRVYEEVQRIAGNKDIGVKELEAIIASSAMQVVPTYKLKSYVINNGNIITPTAHVVLDKGGEIMQGVCVGDGPIDAAFLAIEQITGHHFELDEFQIQAVTEGREAMGSGFVKLISDGKCYSGKGISTDVIGASINAYINALNKIYFEEENK